MAFVFEGVEIETTPGAMLELECGDHDMVDGVFEVGAPYTCRETECGIATTITGVVPFEIVPITVVSE